MTYDVVTISPQDNIEDCMQVMTEEHIRHLPVVEDGKLIGLVSIGDVVKAMITSREFTIETTPNVHRWRVYKIGDLNTRLFWGILAAAGHFRGVILKRRR